MKLVCLFVTEVLCTVSMVLSGDLVAPRTDLDYSGGLPDRVLTPRKLSQSPIVSYGQLCRGEWETRVPNPHRPHDVTINLCAFDPILHIDRAALPKIPHEE